jgi:hypothetical protein
MPLQPGAFGYAPYPGAPQGYARVPQGYAPGAFPTPELASGVPMSADQYQLAMAQAAMAQAMAYGQPGMMPGAQGQDVAMGGYPMFSVNTAWGTVPNNLAGEGVRDTERELEIKTIWADSVLDTINVFDQPVITMGDEPKVEGVFIWKKLVRCDVEVPANTMVMTVLGAANHDPSVFDDPHTLRLDRPNSRNHLAFAAGVHYCLGASLAKLEATIAIGSLIRRFADVELAGDPSWRDRLTIRGVDRLPLTTR